jgi:hypothetical protein
MDIERNVLLVNQDNQWIFYVYLSDPDHAKSINLQRISDRCIIESILAHESGLKNVNVKVINDGERMICLLRCCYIKELNDKSGKKEGKPYTIEVSFIDGSFRAYVDLLPLDDKAKLAYLADLCKFI